MCPLSITTLAVTYFLSLLRRDAARLRRENTMDGRVRMARESLLVCTPAYRPRRPVFRPYSPTLYSEILEMDLSNQIRADFFEQRIFTHII